MRKFKVFWKGDCVGEFSVEEIRDRVGRGDFGALHGVLLDSGKTVSVAEVLRCASSREGPDIAGEFEAEAPAAEKNFDFLIFGYVLAGLAFVSWTSLFGAVFYCAFLYKSGRGQLARQFLTLSLLIGILGFCFNKFVLAAL